MRSISDRFNPDRSIGIIDVRSKYIFAFEGYSTEISYFNGLIEHRGIARIRDLVRICILQREAIDSGCSDPLVLLELLKDSVRAMVEGRHTPRTMSDSVKGEVGTNLGLLFENICSFKQTQL